MKFKTAYIAGPVSGKDPAIVGEMFNRQAEILESQGYKVVNPVTYVAELIAAYFKQFGEYLNDDVPWQRKLILNACISKMAMCEEVHLLPGWKDSKGATMERDIALRMGKLIFYP
ncbi:hypothetical protein D3C72_1068270 [compost metagenome]